jgi:hypothetical protein
MQITCAMSKIVQYIDRDGTVKQCVLRPGKHNYPMLKPKNDPMLADTLRVLRKHKHISFDDLLPSDAEVLKNAPPGADKTAYLADKVLLRPSPKGRKTDKKKAVKNDDGGHRKKDKTPETTEKNKDESQKQGKVSYKK